MAATVSDFLDYCLTIYPFQNTGKNKDTAKIIAHHFSSLEAFLKAKRSDFSNIRLVGSNKPLDITNNLYESIRNLQTKNHIDPKISVSENFIRLLVRKFISKQLNMINSLTVSDLNCNPILIGALNLNTPDDILEFYVYQSVSRSVVTSLGYLVQDILVRTSDFVSDAKNLETPSREKWDILVEKTDGIKHWLEVKSGPNDMDKTQILSYKNAMDLMEKTGDKAYFGFTYGRRDSRTVTYGLLETYVPNWVRKTLIGRELWDFVTDDNNYHVKLIELLFRTSGSVLKSGSIVSAINKRVNLLRNEFRGTYPKLQDFLNSLW